MADAIKFLDKEQYGIALARIKAFNEATYAKANAVVTALGTNGNYLTWTKNGTANNITVPYATSAGTATKVGSSTVGSSTMPIYLNAGTPTAISSFPEAYLSWGGKNFSGSYGPIDAAMIDDLGPNRWAFLKAERVTIEYSTNGGTTWTDYGASDAQKISFFSSIQQLLYVGKVSAASSLTINLKLRVTVRTGLSMGQSSDLYSTLNKFVISTSCNGATSGCYCTISGRLQSNIESESDTWAIFADEIPVSGDTGYNVINISGRTTYGNTSGKATQYGEIRFEFGFTKTPTYRFAVRSISAFGGVGWSVPSNMAKNGHIYSWDANQTAYFPGAVYPSTSGKALGGTSNRWALYSTTGNFTDTITTDRTNSTLGIDSNYKIGQGVKALHIGFGQGSGTALDSGYADGITFGTATAAHAGIYVQSSGSYGTRMIFGTTGSYSNGAYGRVIIDSSGKVGIATMTPSYTLHVAGTVYATSFVKSSGTSAQFLKADGSVDSNAYIYGTTNQSIIRGVSTEAETWSNLGYADADKGKYNLMIVRHSSSVKNSFGGTGMNYGNTLFFGGADTRAYMGVAYNAPRVVFGGGSLGATSASSVPDWYMILTGTDATTYNLATIASQAANGNSAYNSLSNYLPLTGGTMTGSIILDDNNSARIRKNWTGSDNIAALTCNYSGTTTSGFARNAVLLAVDDNVYFRIGMYGSYTANATDNKPSYIYIGQYGYNGLNLRIGMDDTLKWGDHEIWHKGIDTALTPWYHHNYSNGILVTTDFGNNTTQYPLIKIEGRSHNGANLYPVLTYIQSYIVSGAINSNASRAYHLGMDLGTIYLFLNSDKKFCIWFEQTNSNSTIWVSVYNKGRYNVIATHENAAMPTEGITSKVTVTSKHNAFEATDVSFTTVTSGDISSTGNITTTGNIGIGTTSPTSRLQVHSADYSYINTRLSGAAIYFDKLSTNTTGFNNHVTFRRVDADMNIVEQVRLIGAYSGSAYVCTYIAGSSYNDSAMRIDGSGTSATVGIGLANAATYKLQVGGNVMANGYYTDGEDGYYNANGSGTYYKNMYMTSGGSLILGYGSAQAGGSTYVSGNILIFRYGTAPTEAMRINASGNVGIGTTSPSYKLHVSGTFRATSTATVSTLAISSTSGVNHINFSRVGGNYINFPASTSSAQSAVCISTGGAASANTILAVVNTTSQAKRVGILNTSPSYTLDVTGVIHSTTGIFSDGYVSAYGVASSSDARLKDGISAISYGRAKEVLSALKPSEWTWKKDGRRGAGMVAQEVQPVLPDTVSEIGGNLTLEYNTAFAYGLAATKYMLPMVESHEEKIARLEEEVEDLRKELKHFKN